MHLLHLTTLLLFHCIKSPLNTILSFFTILTEFTSPQSVIFPNREKNKTKQMIQMMKFSGICLLWLLALSEIHVMVLGQEDVPFPFPFPFGNNNPPPNNGGGTTSTSTSNTTASGGKAPPLVPAMFIFGDSLIDNGNNNNLASLAKANYFPYGIDFNGGPTGRFSNGYTMVDTIAELLGLPLVPPFSEATRDQMRYGVNYASAAAGILDNTGQNFVGRIPFNQQIKNFENTLDQITANNGAPDLAQGLSKSIFFVGMGSNDYLNNYLMPNYDTKSHYNAQQFADFLTQQYTQQLTRLYNLGARKFVIAGIGLMGCIPSILSQSPAGICSDSVNQLILPFNINSKTMINNLSTNLPGSKFAYIDIHNMFQDLLQNYQSYGFNVINRGCCGIGRNRGQITCLPFQVPCPQRERYIFWDAFHPTEAVNNLFGRNAFDGGIDFVHPINIQQLASL